MEINDLSEKQQKVIELFLQGKNLFISGGAGCGKSYLLNFLKRNFANNGLEITASTGIAAVNIGGSTIHSWAGIGLANQPIEQILENIFLPKFSKVRRKIIKTKTLAIDEISMISREVLEILDQVFRAVRGNEKPMCGMQMLLFGDFLQLPPINRDNNSSNFCFDSKIWDELNFNNIILDKIFRQSD